ncbi:MAG: hypothetical protein M1817_002169 [Caeruleum heppii]|nr:MAG: hypothetical protein M1817_002169 [Caeruleum heppii]
MASRILVRSARTPISPLLRSIRAEQSRAFQTGRTLMETPAAALPIRKPVGAFRGGLFGFLLGSTAAGAAVYYYILEEYKVSNELLTEDIYSLQAAVQKIHTYVQNMEEKVDALEKRKK